MKQPNIHQKINLRMIGLLDQYVITKHPVLRKWIPSNLKGKARYNTCYDFPRPAPPLEMINEYISQKSDRVRTYLKNNLSNYKYLRVDIFPTNIGFRNKFSLMNELPEDHLDLERTGSVRFVDVKDVRLK